MKKVELHVHTQYSKDSRTTLRQIIEKCQREKIDVLAVTDHNEIEGAVRLQKIAPFQVIVGEEILTHEGEIVGLFLKEKIPSGLPAAKVIALVRKQGGLTYLPHPFDSFTRKTAPPPKSVTNLATQVDIIEVHNGRTVFSFHNQKAQRLSQQLRKNSCGR